MRSAPSVEADDRPHVEVTGLTVVLPAFNEARSAAAVISALRDTLEPTGWPFEIIVVDDGSADGTADEANSAGARVLRHRSNRGYGAALKTGIRHAQFPLVCIGDMDGTYPMERIPDLVETLEAHGADMVVGARTGEAVAIPLVRRPAKWILGRFAEMVAGQPIPDLNSGLRVFYRSTVLRMFGLLPDGFSFTTTVTLALITNGHLVDYVPIDYHQRVGKSKFRPIQDTANFASLILRIALYFVPLKFFLPISAFLLVAAAAWGLASKLALGELADVSTVLLVISAVQVAVMGLLAEMINRRMPNSHRDDH